MPNVCPVCDEPWPEDETLHKLSHVPDATIRWFITEFGTSGVSVMSLTRMVWMHVLTPDHQAGRCCEGTGVEGFA